MFILEYDYQIDELLNIIKTLSVEDYSESTIKDNEIALVFGKSIEVEIYIKIKISEELRKKVICISFHEAEIPMKYPYKKGGQIK